MTLYRAMSSANKLIICDRIWENPPYGIQARFAQCVFLVAQVEICQSSDFTTLLLTVAVFYGG